MNIKHIVSGLGLLALTACNHLLDTKPYTFSSGDNYYENEAQVLRAVNGVYGRLQELYTSDFWALTEMVADNTNYQYDEGNRGAQQREEIDEFLITSSNTYVNTAWALLYSIVKEANVVIGRMDNVAFADQTLKNRYTGELKFLRGLAYFHLVRLFGEIPMHTEEISGPADAFKSSKATVDQVYAAIVQDAQDAVASLPDGYTGNDVGRATKGAALTLLGDVYLTRKQYADAVTALQQVTALGYSLLPDYADCFSPTAKNNAESVFEVQYDQSVEGENSNFIFMFGPRDAKLKLVGFTGTLGGSNIPTPSIYNLYEPGDLRRDKSIELFDDPSNANYAESVAFGGKMPFIKKFYHPPYPEDGRSNENWPVYRYAHVLLMLAEAQHEAGTGDPYQNLNPVRQRAGLPPLSGLSPDDLRDAIAKEQRVEVAFENHRWYQLLRTGKAQEVMNAHGVNEKARLTRLSSAAYNVQPFRLLFPIPQREIQLNGFPQNDEY